MSTTTTTHAAVASTTTAPSTLTAITSHNQYITDGIPNKESLKSNPLEQFQIWFNEAIESKIVPEPEAVALSTVSTKGIPSTRFVLLKKVDDKGFVFYTNYESRKGQELFNSTTGEGGFASMAFYWREQHRSVRIVGKVEKVSAEETKEYFDSRGVGSRVGAWASRQSRVLSNREELEDQVKAIEKKFGVNENAGEGSGVGVGPNSEEPKVESKEIEIPPPPYWGGVRLIPFEVEFWAGMDSRLHDRAQYTLGPDSTWSIDRLSP